MSIVHSIAGARPSGFVDCTINPSFSSHALTSRSSPVERSRFKKEGPRIHHAFDDSYGVAETSQPRSVWEQDNASPRSVRRFLERECEPQRMQWSEGFSHVGTIEAP